MTGWAWGHDTLALSGLPSLGALTKALDSTDTSSSTRSKLVLQLAHSTLGGDVGRGSGILWDAGVGGARFLLDARLLLDIGVGLRELAIDAVRTG